MSNMLYRFNDNSPRVADKIHRDAAARADRAGTHMGETV